MPALTPERRSRVARIAADARWKREQPEVVTARRDYAAERLEDYIRRTVEAAPPLSDEQRDRLAGLLRTPVAGGAG